MGSDMRVVAIIQARMGSSRLPNKVLAEIDGKPLLEILLERMSRARNIDKLVVATTSNPKDDVLVEWLVKKNINFFRGSELDVLDRYWQCARLYQADIVVRLTADDPLKDPSIIDLAIELLLANKDIDYVSNTLNPTFPEGLDVEVFRYRALERAQNGATLQSDREHVTPYIWRKTETFNVKNFSYVEDLSEWRWTVDKACDLDFMRAVLGGMGMDYLVGFDEIISYIKKNPTLMNINMGTVRNEGYLNSLQREEK